MAAEPKEPKSRLSSVLKLCTCSALLLIFSSIVVNLEYIYSNSVNKPSSGATPVISVKTKSAKPRNIPDYKPDVDEYSMDTYELIYPDLPPNEGGGPTPACHAGTILHMASGGILAAFFGGEKEGAVDVAIYITFRFPGPNGTWPRTWSYPRMEAKVELNLPHWNPVLHCGNNYREAQACPGSDLWLFYKTGVRTAEWGCCGTWKTLFQRSFDGARNWTWGAELVPGDDRGGRGPVKNKIVRLSDGAWLAPASLEKDGPWRAFTDRSTDGGQTWTPSADILVPEGLYENGVIQPTLWESEPGQVHMLLRSRHAYMKYTAEKAYNAPRSRIFRADSTDGGRTWGVPYPLKLPNPNSGIDLVKLPHSGTLVLVHNPGFIGRSPLRMSISHDNGVTWPMGYDMVREPGEFSYPSIISWPDHWQSEGVSVIFTWNRRSMAFFRISLEELERRANETNYLPDEAFVYPYEGEQIPMKKGPKGDLRIDHSKFDKFHKTHAAHKDL